MLSKLVVEGGGYHDSFVGTCLNDGTFLNSGFPSFKRLYEFGVIYFCCE